MWSREGLSSVRMAWYGVRRQADMVVLWPIQVDGRAFSNPGGGGERDRERVLLQEGSIDDCIRLSQRAG